MKIRNLAALAVAGLLSTQGAWAQDEEVEPQEDPFREKAKHKDSDEEEDEEGDRASADRTFGNSGEVVISAERLLGIARTARTTTLDGADSKSTADRAHVLVNANGDPVGYSTPRLAFDFFVSDGLSLGAALGYSVDSSAFDEKLLLVSPRAGYALMFGKVVGVWPRLGITFQDQETAGTKVTLLAASAEIPVVFVAADNVALSLGPAIDLSVVGKIDPVGDPKKTDFSAHEIGFTGAVSFFF